MAPRPKYQASHGMTVETHGTPAASHASETGFTTSGVEVTSIRSTLSLLMSALANWLARAGSDCHPVDDLDFVLLAAGREFIGQRLARETKHGIALAESPERPSPRSTNPILITSLV